MSPRRCFENVSHIDPRREVERVKVFNIEPVPKPRMTQADKWKKRPPVLKYFAFKDEVKLNKITLPESHYIHSTHAEELE